MIKLISEPNSGLLASVEVVIRSATESRSIFLRTSGTTGIPKNIECNLGVALDKKRVGQTSEKWLLTYSPERWAGVSVILHALRAGAALCVPRSLAFADLIEAGCVHQVTHLSLTPSMLRSLVVHDSEGKLSQIPLVQVTFGGEAATQSVLDLASSIWKQARVTHVYASTELGDICSVSDGKEGIPQAKFSGATFNPNGELVLNGRATGDLWEWRGDRYYFMGRLQEIINVGGNKVSPLIIEEFAVECGATMARAFGIPSSLLGALVGLDYVGRIGKQELNRKFREKFPKYMCPVEINNVQEITLSTAGKIRRVK
jgi:acyl-CoA synthetase (AMP-forming)/AMP-acid ligase II